MAAKIIDGAFLSSKIKAEVKEYTSTLTVKPHLAVVLCSNDPASSIYVNKKVQTCNEVGIESTVIDLSKSNLNSTDELKSVIQHLNESSMHGILLQLPLSPNLNPKVIFDVIDPLKDVDVVNPENVGLLLQGRSRYKPCTPAGIQYLLTYNGIETSGKKVCIINRSDIVGKPLIALLSQNENDANATCILCHDHTPPKTLKELTLQSDIVIVAVGIRDFLKADMIKENAVIIDVGINRLAGSKKIVGDCCSDVMEKAGWITPVPGGVGPMTVAMLLKNTVEAYKNQLS